MTVESFLQKQQDIYEALFDLVEALRNDRIQRLMRRSRWQDRVTSQTAVQHMMAQAEAVLKSWETTSHGREDEQ